jgi:CDP-diacylglycerol--glycerol-3-phosphate 3-phosphatidyltransferase
MNLPNKLTVARCLMAIVFVVCLSVDSLPLFAVGYAVFIVAALTDYFDGKIARQRNLVTNFGKLLDPVADKILMVAAFIMMMGIPELWLPGWTVVAIISRELLVTGARSLGAAEGAVIPANQWGKVKTAVQMTFVIAFLPMAFLVRAMTRWPAFAELLPGEPACYAQALSAASHVCITLVAIYTLVSGAQFVWFNWRLLRLH